MLSTLNSTKAISIQNCLQWWPLKCIRLKRQRNIPLIEYGLRLKSDIIIHESAINWISISRKNCEIFQTISIAASILDYQFIDFIKKEKSHQTEIVSNHLRPMEQCFMWSKTQSLNITSVDFGWFLNEMKRKTRVTWLSMRPSMKCFAMKSNLKTESIENKLSFMSRRTTEKKTHNKERNKLKRKTRSTWQNTWFNFRDYNALNFYEMDRSL